MSEQITFSKLGRNDQRILDMVCRANGGGVALLDEPLAPCDRLRKAKLIKRKIHPRSGNQPWVHTELGWLVWSTRT